MADLLLLEHIYQLDKLYLESFEFFQEHLPLSHLVALQAGFFDGVIYLIFAKSFYIKSTNEILFRQVYGSFLFLLTILN